MNILIQKENDEIVVTVTAELCGPNGQTKIWRNADVEKELHAKSIKFGKNLVGNILTNTNPGKILAIWKYEDLSVKKKVDKRPESVLPSVNEEKPTPKRRKRRVLKTDEE